MRLAVAVADPRRYAAEQARDLWERYRPLVFRVAMSVTRNRDDAEDATQETFRVVFSRLSDGLVIDDPERYLSTAAYSQAVTIVRQHGRFVELRDVHADSRESFRRAAVVGELIQAAADQLPPAQRRAVQLRSDGRSYSEIAADLGLDHVRLVDGAAVMSSGEEAAKKLYLRGARVWRDKVLDQIARRPGGSPECAAKADAIWKRVLRQLSNDEARDLGEHLTSCAFCRETEEQYLDAKRYAAILPLLPSRRDRRHQLDHLLVGARLGTGKRGRALRLLPLLLLLLFGGQIADVPPVRPAHLAIARTVVSAAERPVAIRDPSPVPSVPVAKPTPTPSPRPTGGYVSPCPPAATGGYAYLHAGELYYSPGLGMTPVALTSTGGRVDNFWWSPDGRRLAFKIPSSLPNIRGDIRVIDLQSRTTTWDLGRAVDFFSFSPDGTSWAAGTIDVQNGVLQGIDVLVAAFPSTATQAQTFTAADSEGTTGNPPTPVLFDWTDFQDRPPLLESSMRPDAGIYWEPSGIYEHLDGPDHLYSPTGTYISMGYVDAPLLGQFQGFPPAASFTFGPTGVFTRICAGTSAEVSQVELSGRPTQVTLSGDGRTALVSVHDGGFTMDVARVYADGRTLVLSSDGTSELPRWQP